MGTEFISFMVGLIIGLGLVALFIANGDDDDTDDYGGWL